MNILIMNKESESENHSVMSTSLRPHGLYSPFNSPGQSTGVGSLSLLKEIFPTQGSNSGLLHFRQILYQLSHKGIPRILEWVAYPFSRGSSNPGIEPGHPKETEPVIKIPVPNSFTSQLFFFFPLQIIYLDHFFNKHLL